jgi:hypothetical protein
VKSGLWSNDKRASQEAVVKSGLWSNDKRASQEAVVKSGLWSNDKRASQEAVVKSGLWSNDKRASQEAVVKSGLWSNNKRASQEAGPSNEVHWTEKCPFGLYFFLLYGFSFILFYFYILPRLYRPLLNQIHPGGGSFFGILGMTGVNGNPDALQPRVRDNLTFSSLALVRGVPFEFDMASRF